MLHRDCSATCASNSTVSWAGLSSGFPYRVFRPGRSRSARAVPRRPAAMSGAHVSVAGRPRPPYRAQLPAPWKDPIRPVQGRSAVPVATAQPARSARERTPVHPAGGLRTPTSWPAAGELRGKTARTDPMISKVRNPARVVPARSRPGRALPGRLLQPVRRAARALPGERRKPQQWPRP